MIHNHGTQVHSLFSLLKAEMKLVAIQNSIAGGNRRTLYEKKNSLYKKKSENYFSVVVRMFVLKSV